MEYRQLGSSGLKVPVLALGTANFGAASGALSSWGNTEADGATRLVDVALDAGVNFFDTADIYTSGRSEEILGRAVTGRRDRVLISTKATGRRGDAADINDVGSSRLHLTTSLEASLRRLGTDYIDVFYLHQYDAVTPQEEVLSTLDEFVRSGKVRYIGCSNFSGWQLMKSLSISERYGWARHISHQAHYSLAAREFEWELMPLAIDQNVGTVVWSPLSQSRLTGKLRRGQAPPADSRLREPVETEQSGDRETLFRIVDVLDVLAEETGRSVSQVALNWVLQRPTVSSLILGARNEQQLTENFGAIGWNITADQVARLDAASAVTPSYPYWHQLQHSQERNPFPVDVRGPAVDTGTR